ncbi:MAG: hypothetical protein PPP58_03605 [Natronomonas sp.]
MEEQTYSEVRSEMGLAFDMSITSKMALTVGTLLISTLAAPAVHFRRDLIREIETTAVFAESLSMSVGIAILFGNVSTFAIGLYMLKLIRDRNRASSLTKAQIEQNLRIEDIYMYFQVFGTLAVVVPLVPLLIGWIFPGTITAMYAVEITIYQPFEAVLIDIRHIALVTGAGFGLLLGAMWWYVR